MNGVGSWLRRYRPRPDAAVRLVCFPHAGGHAAFYRSWIADLHEGVELVAVQYPGRMDRSGEAPIDDMERLATRVAEAVANELEPPVALFGHSMGAAVAYEVARRLERDAVTSPVRLFVSAREAPARSRSRWVHLATDEELWNHVRTLGGTDSAVLAQPGATSLLTPALRADFTLIETYRPRRRPPLHAPITAFVADDDPEVSVEDAGAWREETSDGFELRVFRGDHFFLGPRRKAVVDAVAHALAAGHHVQWASLP